MGQTIAWRWQYHPAKMFTLRESVVKVRYDHGNIWVVRTDGKELHLHRDYSHEGLVKWCSAKAQAAP